MEPKTVNLVFVFMLAFFLFVSQADAKDKIKLTEIENLIRDSDYLKSSELEITQEQNNRKIFQWENGPNVTLKTSNSSYTYKNRNTEDEDWNNENQGQNIVISPSVEMTPHTMSGLSLGLGYEYSYQFDEMDPDFYEASISQTPKVSLNWEVTKLLTLDFLQDLEKKNLNVNSEELSYELDRQAYYFDILKTIKDFYQTSYQLAQKDYDIFNKENELTRLAKTSSVQSADYLSKQNDLDKLVNDKQKLNLDLNIYGQRLSFLTGHSIEDFEVNENDMISFFSQSALNILSYEKYTQSVMDHPQIAQYTNKLKSNKIEGQENIDMLIPKISLQADYGLAISQTETDKTDNRGNLMNIDDTYTNTLTTKLSVSIPLDNYTTYPLRSKSTELEKQIVLEEQENKLKDLYLNYLETSQKLNDTLQNINHLRNLISILENDLIKKQDQLAQGLLSDKDYKSAEKQLASKKAYYQADLLDAYYYKESLGFSYFTSK